MTSLALGVRCGHALIEVAFIYLTSITHSLHKMRGHLFDIILSLDSQPKLNYNLTVIVTLKAHFEHQKCLQQGIFSP